MPDFITNFEPPPQLLQRASLFLDVDGTLLELASSPHAVIVSADAIHVLRLAQERLEGRVALISGRSAKDVAALFPGLTLNIGGSHGLEQRWADGRCNQPVRPDAVDHALATLRAFSAQHTGLLVEDKPYGTALHYRTAPHLADESHVLASRLATETGLVLQPGKMVVELKASATNKGDALAAFMEGPPMRGGTPVFLGDDDNDEPGFAMAKKLGGAGVLVGEARDTQADWRLPNVSATLAWLRAGLEATT
jgi:trehalose 6-phosphate phosphatase